MTEADSFAALARREWSDAQVARSYAQAFARAANMVVPHLVSAVAPTSGTKALDLCCGHGNVSAGLVRTGASVTGVDFSPAMLDMAQDAVLEARFVEGNAMELEFDDEEFDTVTIGFGIPHVPDPPAVLKEARRVLLTGGKLAFSVWCGPEVDTALGYVFDAIATHGHPDIRLPPGPGANDYANPALSFPVLGAVGFRECSCTTVASMWCVDDPGAPFDFFREGTARGGALLRPQPAENAAAIRDAVIARVLENHGDGPVWDVPIPAVVTKAVAT